MNQAKQNADLKPVTQNESLGSLLFKFGLYLILFMMLFNLEMATWPLLAARLSAQPDWFLQLEPRRAPLFSLSLPLYLAPGAVALVSLMHLYRQWPDKLLPQRPLRLGIRALTVISYPALIVLAVIHFRTRQEAWEMYAAKLDAVVAAYKPCLSVSEAETPLKALKMPELVPGRHLYSILYHKMMSQVDVHTVELSYDAHARLTGWSYRISLSGAGGDKILRQYPPAKAVPPRPCP